MSSTQRTTNQNEVTTSNINELHKNLMQELHRFNKKRESYNFRRKFNRAGLRKIVKMKNLTIHDFKKARQLDHLSQDNLVRLAKLRRIKNYDNLSKEDLIYTLLRSEINPYEYNYMRHIQNTSNNEPKEKVNLIRTRVNELGDILDQSERRSIREELYELENRRRFTKIQKEKALNYLNEIEKTLYKKEKYQYNDNYGLNYHRLEDVEHLFKDISGTEYYKPILARSSFKNGYEEYEIRSDKDKNMSLQSYLHTITPELTELIREKKLSTQNEQKAQLNIAIKFKHFTNVEKSYSIYVKSKNKETRQGDDTDNIIAKLLETFMENYEREQDTLRNASNFVFDYVDLTIVKFHSIELKRGGSYIPTPKMDI